MKTGRVGERFLTNEGYWITIIEYFNSLNCTIKFDDGVIVYNRTYGNIVKGEVRNTNHRSVEGVGYLGVGEYSNSVNNIDTEYYLMWSGIIRRCYSKNRAYKNNSYHNCSVELQWHNLQIFAKWYEENYNSKVMIGWELDKDILQKGNKIYSSETCCFVPKEINKLFVKCASSRGIYPIGVHLHKPTGRFVARTSKNGKRVHIGTFDTIEEAFQAYKIAKESHIKEVADLWKPFIKQNVHQAMYAYEIEITD